MDSPCESESSLDGVNLMLPPSPISREEQWQKRIESLTQQNRVLKVEMETYKIKIKVLQEENRALRQASVIIQAKAEQEEEYISNTLLKKIQALKKEKETLAHHYEREEECLTNDLSRKLDQLRQEKCKLEQTLEQEQECLVNKLMRKIEKLEAETLAKQTNLEQLRREMIELENTLEQEQEALVNKLWKRMDKLEAEKRSLQIKLDQPADSTPKYDNISDITNSNGSDTASNLSNHIQTLRSEVIRLRNNLAAAQKETNEKTQQFAAEEKCIREENLRLQRKLQMEVERREALCRHLSESESSLEMDEERMYNESLLSYGSSQHQNRQRTISSPIPHSPSGSRPISPGSANFPARCCTCGQILSASSSAFFHPIASAPISGRRTSERFIKPAIPTPGLNTSAPSIMPASFVGLGLGSASSLTPGSSSGGMGGESSTGGNRTSDHSSSSTASSMNNSFSSNNSMTTPTSALPPPTTGGSSSSNPGTPGSGPSGSSAFIQPASPMDTSSNCKE